MIPFLEGWAYLVFDKQETVKKGFYKTVFSRPCKGWLVKLEFGSDDAYASVKVTLLEFTSIYTIQDSFVIGALLPPSAGAYVRGYIRPSILSSAGVFAGYILNTTYPQPIRGLVRFELGLEADSTQTEAAATVSFVAIEIVDDKAFIRSYRKFKYGWLGWAFGVLSRIPGLKYIGIPDEIKEVVEVD